MAPARSLASFRPFITGYAENATFGDADEAGAQMVTKPFAIDALAGRIRAIIEG